ncbi:7131_t:CDS:2, partial [Cetraspora pellucida]
DDKKSSGNNIIKLGFPSLSTTIGQIPIDEAARIACEVIKEFLNSHKNDWDFQLILIDQDERVLNIFELEWKKFKENEESRFQIKLGDFVEIMVEIEIEYIVNESTWRLKPDVTPLSKSLYEVIGSKLFEEMKRLYPNPGIVGEAYPVPIPSTSEFYKGVNQIIYVISPNMNPSRPDPVSLEVAKNALKESYQSMLNAFWTLKNGQQYTPRRQQSQEKRSAFDVLMGIVHNSASTPKPTTRSSSSTHTFSWGRDVLLPYCERPEIFSDKEVYSYDDNIVIIWDKYPKAKIHLLVMPRQLKIDSLEELKKQDLNLIQTMKRKGQQVIDS